MNQFQYLTIEEIGKEILVAESLVNLVEQVREKGSPKNPSFLKLMHSIGQIKKFSEIASSALTNLPKNHNKYELLKVYYELVVATSDYLISFYEEEVLKKPESN